MNTEKKYLSKKRKKIFSIKNCSKSNNNKKNNYKSREVQPHSLTNITRLVLEYFQKNNKTTGNEITEYIIDVLGANDSDEKTKKNIQRRVYDSINIMSPGNIIKNKQKLIFLNNNENMTNINNEEINNNINNNEEDEEEDRYLNEEEMKEYNSKLKQLKNMQKKLIKQYITLKFYEKYSNNNSKPNINVKENGRSAVEGIKYENRKIIKKNGNEWSIPEFENLTSYEIMKKIMAPDILAKLNNESKKNNNINININSINNDINCNNKNEENDEIFNYLKNVELFREELTNSLKKSNKRKIIKNNKKSKNKNNRK